MAHTPPWATRLEHKIDQVLKNQGQEEKCYYHTKFGAAAQRKCDPPCRFAMKLMENEKEVQKVPSLSPIVDSILNYMKPMQGISPIQSPIRPPTKSTMQAPIRAPILANGKVRHRQLEEDIVPVQERKKKKN